MATPWAKLPKKVQDAILYGTGEEEIDFVYEDGVRRYTNTKSFEGVIGNIERRFREPADVFVAAPVALLDRQPRVAAQVDDFLRLGERPEAGNAVQERVPHRDEVGAAVLADRGDRHRPLLLEEGIDLL